MTQPVALYRAFDSDKVLLYAGISVQPGVRWQQHANEKTWWERVRLISLTWYETRKAAEKAEDQAISEEKPLFNSRIPRNPSLVATCTRVPEELYAHLREAAFDRHVSQASIITAALEAYLADSDR